MKRYRIPLAALAVAAAVVVPARVASAGTGLTGCTVTFSNATIYKTDGGVSNPTSSTATIDVSGTAVKPASFFFHVADSSGHHTTSIEQTSSTSIDYNRTWLQWIGDASGGTYFTTTEPLAVDVIVANSDVWGQPYICYGTLTLMPDGAPSAPSGVSAVAGNREATVSWTPWKNFAGQTFTVTSDPDGKTCTATYPTTSCTVTGLTNGKSYTFTVTTSTSGGESLASTPSESVAPSGSGGGGDLPPTGADTTTLMMAALMALAAGGLIVRSAGRRQTP